MSKFYTYNQNNSGGKFHFDEVAGITRYVVVEANDYKHADYLAERIGLYFDGYGDCPCCGERWSTMWDESEGKLLPMIYDNPVDKATGLRWMEEGKEIVVHYLNGRKEWFGITRE